MSNATHAGALGEKLIEAMDKMCSASPEEFEKYDREFKEAGKLYGEAVLKEREENE
jgi:hypothetical protein